MLILSILLEKTDAAKPYMVLLALSIKSSMSLNFMICITGPKIWQKKNDLQITQIWKAGTIASATGHHLLELARSDLQMTPRKFWGLHKLLLAKQTLTVSVKKTRGNSFAFQVNEKNIYG